MSTPKATVVRFEKILAEDTGHLYIAFEAHSWMLDLLHDLAIPAIGLKSRHCLNAPRVAYDLNGALRHAVNTLLRAGRRSIVVPPVHEPAPHAEAVLQKLYAEWNLPFDTATAMPVFDGTKDGLVKLSEMLFRRPVPPDGMVLYDPLHLVTLQGWLASKGLQLTSDFSVIVINHDPLMDSVYPSIPHYAAPVGPVVTTMHRIIDSFFSLFRRICGWNPVPERREAPRSGASLLKVVHNRPLREWVAKLVGEADGCGQLSLPCGLACLPRRNPNPAR